MWINYREKKEKGTLSAHFWGVPEGVYFLISKINYQFTVARYERQGVRCGLQEKVFDF